MAAAILIVTTCILGTFWVGATRYACQIQQLPQAETTALVRKTLMIFTVWTVFIAVLAGSGFLSDFSALPPRFFFLFVAILGFTGYLGFSQIGSLWVQAVPIRFLVGFQSFRILAELALFSALNEGLAPVQMTFEGMNFDIFSGITAIPMFFLLKKHPNRSIVALWNIAALVLLLVIITVALLSAPTPFRYFLNEPANTWVAQFPYVLLPGILVQNALLGHLLVFRWLHTHKHHD